MKDTAEINEGKLGVISVWKMVISTSTHDGNTCVVKGTSLWLTNNYFGLKKPFLLCL